LEEHPLNLNQLKGKAKADYELLKGVLEKYQGRRLDTIKKS